MNHKEYIKRRDFWDAMDGIVLLLVLLLAVVVGLRHMAHRNSENPSTYESR